MLKSESLRNVDEGHGKLKERKLNIRPVEPTKVDPHSRSIPVANQTTTHSDGKTTGFRHVHDSRLRQAPRAPHSEPLRRQNKNTGRAHRFGADKIRRLRSDRGFSLHPADHEFGRLVMTNQCLGFSVFDHAGLL